MNDFPFRLCHCMNVFPGTALADKIHAFEVNLPKVRKALGSDAPFPFGAGIWLDAATVSYLKKQRREREFADYIKSLGFCVFTANAFPYGTFHGQKVKTAVYHPDWSETDRMEYTCAVADILALFAEEGEVCSISTLPCGYKGDFTGSMAEAAAKNLLQCADHLRRIEYSTGHRILLGIEMEPDCYLESPDELIRFYNRYLRNDERSQWIGICYDTCHQELEGGAPGSGLKAFLKEEIPVAKIQLSAAVRAPEVSARKSLGQFFQDQVYLHQTRAVRNNEVLRQWKDLPDAMLEPDVEPDADLVVHFHIPVYTEDAGYGLLPAKAELSAVLDQLRKNPEICSILEIETYSFGVLPNFLKQLTLEEAMAREMRCIMEILQK